MPVATHLAARLLHKLVPLADVEGDVVAVHQSLLVGGLGDVFSDLSDALVRLFVGGHDRIFEVGNRTEELSDITEE